MAGDSVLAVFDTATGAVTAALAIQRSSTRSPMPTPEGPPHALSHRRAPGRRDREGRRHGVRRRREHRRAAAGAGRTRRHHGVGCRCAARSRARSQRASTTRASRREEHRRSGARLRGVRSGAAAAARGPARARPSASIDLSLPDKPSIAVLPFVNMSGDPEQEYFTDGITEDIITELSRFHSLFVIARNSSFSYKGQSPDIRRVGKELGVRYVLEGSIRKSAQRIRVTGAADRRAQRQPPLGRALRPRARRHLRGAGGTDAQHRRGDRAAHRRCRAREGASTPPREPGCLRTCRQRLGQELGGLLQRRCRPAQRSAGRGPGRLAIDPRSSRACRSWPGCSCSMSTLARRRPWRRPGRRASRPRPGRSRSTATTAMPMPFKAYLLSFAPDKQLAAEDLRQLRGEPTS